MPGHEPLRVLSLFAGIGSFDLGLENTGGFKTVAQVEINPFCQRVLKKHWPEVPIYDDVRHVTAERLRADGVFPDVIVGGFPCQAHSVAGKRLASADERDLWPDFARLIREIKPRWVVAENVPGLYSSESGRFFGRILRDLARAGYDAEWRRISAEDVGAPHLRERVWIVAYPAIGDDWRHSAGSDERHEQQPGTGTSAGDVQDTEPSGGGAVRGVPGVAGDEGRAAGQTGREGLQPGDRAACANDVESNGQDVPNTERDRLEGAEPTERPAPDLRRRPAVPSGQRKVSDTAVGRCVERGAFADPEQRPKAVVNDARGTGAGGNASIASGPRLEIGETTLREWAHATTAGSYGRTTFSRFRRVDVRIAKGLDESGPGKWHAEWPGVARIVTTEAEKINRRQRVMALGDTCMPDIVEIIGYAILEAERRQKQLAFALK